MVLPKIRDEKSRAALLAILRLGISKKQACKAIGCDHSTLTRECQVDPEFKIEVSSATLKGKISLVRMIVKASASDWRAAAWMLERKWPEEFSKRAADAITPDQLSAALDAEALDAIECMTSEQVEVYISKRRARRITPPMIIDAPSS